MSSCGAFCSFCGRCGRHAEDLAEGIKPPVVPPPGSSMRDESEKRLDPKEGSQREPDGSNSHSRTPQS